MAPYHSDSSVADSSVTHCTTMFLYVELCVSFFFTSHLLPLTKFVIIKKSQIKRNNSSYPYAKDLPEWVASKWRMPAPPPQPFASLFACPFWSQRVAVRTRQNFACRMKKKPKNNHLLWAIFQVCYEVMNINGGKFKFGCCFFFLYNFWH